MYDTYNTGSYKPGRDWRNTITVFMGSCLLAFLLCVYGCHWFVANQYDHAPSCGGKNINQSLSPCTYQTTHVTHEATRWESTGRSSSKMVYVLDLDNSSGGSLSVTVVDPDFWEEVTPHDPVRVQMWQGKSAMLYARGMKTQTENNPDYARSTWQRYLLTGGALSVVAIVFSLLAPYLKLNQSSGNDWANLKGD